VASEAILNRARDELFSHINRCGVLAASEEDQRHWMDETIEYLAERYPDLTEQDLQQLHTVGMRFCQPVIQRTRRTPVERTAAEPATTEPETAGPAEERELVPHEAGAENTAAEN